MEFHFGSCKLVFLVTLFSLIPNYRTYEDDQRHVHRNCPVSSHCISAERCPPMNRLVNANADGSTEYISCSITENLALPSLGICCNGDLLNDNANFHGDFHNPKLDVRLPPRNSDLPIADGIQEFNTEDFTRRAARGATDQVHTQSHSQPHVIAPPSSYSQIPDVKYNAPPNYDSLDMYRTTDHSGVHKYEKRGGGNAYYSGLEPEELAYVLENQSNINEDLAEGYQEGFGDNSEFYASTVDKDSFYEGVPFIPSKQEESFENDIESDNQGYQQQPFPYFQPHLVAYNLYSKLEEKSNGGQYPTGSGTASTQQTSAQSSSSSYPQYYPNSNYPGSTPQYSQESSAGDATSYYNSGSVPIRNQYSPSSFGRSYGEQSRLNYGNSPNFQRKQEFRYYETNSQRISENYKQRDSYEIQAKVEYKDPQGDNLNNGKSFAVEEVAEGSQEKSENGKETAEVKYDQPGYYEGKACPWQCRGRPGPPGPIGERGFRGPPGPPGPPGKVIYINVPVPVKETEEYSSSQPAYSLSSSVDTYSDDKYYDNNNDDHVQVQQYENSEVKNQYFEEVPRYSRDRHFGKIPGYQQFSNKMPPNYRHQRRNRRSVDVPLIEQQLSTKEHSGELKRLISQLIHEYFQNSNNKNS